MNIIATSRRNLMTLLGPNVAVITFRNPGSAVRGAARHVALPSGTLRLRISANDITPEQHGFDPNYILFNEDHARRILDFVRSLPPTIETLVVACLHGESRSVAVVAALKHILLNELPPEYLENQHIYDTILNDTILKVFAEQRRAALDEITNIGIDAGSYFLNEDIARLMNTDELRAAYPTLYPPTLPNYAMGIPAGWGAILSRLSERLKDKPIEVLQIKEKFGGLRFYFKGPRDDETKAALIDAQTESWVTCDVCGEPASFGKPSIGGFSFGARTIPKVPLRSTPTAVRIYPSRCLGSTRHEPRVSRVGLSHSTNSNKRREYEARRCIGYARTARTASYSRRRRVYSLRRFDIRGRCEFD
jgi:predicted protein tyrosine phosphatase